MSKEVYILPIENLTNEDKMKMKHFLCHWCCKDLVELIILLGETYNFKIKEFENE